MYNPADPHTFTELAKIRASLHQDVEDATELMYAARDNWEGSEGDEKYAAKIYLDDTMVMMERAISHLQGFDSQMFMAYGE